MDTELSEIKIEGGSQTLPRGFKQFDIISTKEVDSIRDHHYFWPSVSLSPSITKQIRKEWRFLEKSLPDSIFVRVYEKRVDLLRAVIIGPTGTPFHDGLFFFDIQVPSNYPASPPNVYYRSFGHKLNPKLYGWGSVCSSLLETWSGHISQRWNPSNSSILQVLVSIQDVVLNAKPYFNEPGNGGYFNSTDSSIKRKSLRYNEDVFIRNCKTMMSILSKPPESFEKIVSQHFRDRTSNILVACNAYINDQAVIGDPIIITADAETTTSLTSSTFKSKAVSLYPRLVDSFVKNGSSLESVELLDTSKNMRAKVNRQDCIYGFLLMLLLVLGLVFSILDRDGSLSHPNPSPWGSTPMD